MGVLDSVMREEYDRINRIMHNIEVEINSLPKGYISEKKIKGKIYYYLQYRENNKVKSSYLKKETVDSYRALIEHRKELEKELKYMKADRRKLERVLR